jgi:hypothetical protein
MKTVTIVFDISKNITDYSIPSAKSEEVESGFGIMRIEGYKVIFKCLCISQYKYVYRP